MNCLLAQLTKPPLDRLLTGDAAATRQGLETSLEHSWPWAPWVTILLIGAAALYVFAIYLRESSTGSITVKIGLALIRLALVGIIVWMMYGFVVRPFRTDLPDLLVVLDDSGSMSIVDQYDDKELRTIVEKRLRESELEPATRLNQAKAILTADDSRLLRGLQENYQLQLTSIGSAKPLASAEMEDVVEMLRQHSASRDRSDLGKRLRNLIENQRGRPTAAVVMFTDGITTEGKTLSEVAQYARQRGIPLFMVGLGSDQPARDIVVDDLLVDDVAFVNDLIAFDVSVSGSGYEGQPIEVLLRRQDQPEVLARTTVEIGQRRESVRARLSFRPREEGELQFVVETAVREGEAKPDNNAQMGRVSVRNEKIRVLLVQAYPSFEFRYLKALLGRTNRDEEQQGEQESSLELDVVLQDADPEFSDIDATALRAFPVRREDLFTYDVCIFGDVNPSFLSTTAMSNLRDFVVERGRGLIFFGGPRFFPFAYADTPLADLIPFDATTTTAPPADASISRGFSLNLTPLGMQAPHMQLASDSNESQRTWNTLPPLYWWLETGPLKPGTRVLAEHAARTGRDGQNLPAVMLNYVGAGKVQFHASDETWRWRFRRGDELFSRYWLQTIRYLSRFKLGEDRNVELISDRETYRRGDSVRLRVRFFDERSAPTADDGVTVVLEREGQSSRRVVLRRDATDRGIFTAGLHNLATGSYHGWLATPSVDDAAPSCDFVVAAPDAEMARLEMDAVELRLTAQRSGGKFYTIQTADGLLKDLPDGRQVRIESLPPVPVWSDWKVALLFMTLIASEWLLRRRVGLM